MSDREVSPVAVAPVDRDVLREAIKDEYREVAENPQRGFHFHTGRRLTQIVGYRDEWLEGVPESSIESFAGTGCPFAMGVLKTGEHVVDVGCGGGIDSLIAGKMVGPKGRVVGIDMTVEMLGRARGAAKEANATNVEFQQAYAEELPVADEWADVVISNGVFNLFPDKAKALGEFYRVLKPGGRMQIGDIMVATAVPESAKRHIDLWTG
ncbi:MAG TPA: methyltransferase domain-containing protein [Fimbriimonadaceae bacterium]|nr:methyltransferase domain-containing protein [Fimbriimonadaceae bacterium]